jgi:hypothetical protein
MHLVGNSEAPLVYLLLNHLVSPLFYVRALNVDETLNETVKLELAKWDAVKAKYGNFVYTDDPSEVIGIDTKRIWTEFWAQDQFIENVYTEVIEFDGAISAYIVFDKPYEEPESTVRLITTIWNDCDCSGEDEDCSECEGAGTIATDLI